MSKKNLRLVDDVGHRLTLFRPCKDSSDEWIHLEIENEGGDEGLYIACMNLDFIAASELADALIRFSRKLKLNLPEDPEEPPEPTIAQVTCTVDGCLCKSDPPVVTEEPWGWGWSNTPNTITPPPSIGRYKYQVYNVSDGS